MDLFEYNVPTTEATLPERLRPKSFISLYLSETQRNKIKIYMGMIEKMNRIPHLIFWGPPGSGKTSLARILAQQIKGSFISINAIDTGAKKLKEIGETARVQKIELNQTTLVFIDEIHRLNKAQQDVLLPFTERSDFILLGATTENPSYELNSALVSRCQIFVLEPMNTENMIELIEHGFLTLGYKLEDTINLEALNSLASRVSGDARQALNLVELIVHSLEHSAPKNFERPLSIKDLEKLLNQTSINYDKSSDEHYNCISAFIKSVRGSDPDAALYYLARMIQGGEDPKFIARRLIILASEDIGNADPKALSIALSGMDAVEKIGLPEAGINLAQVVTYLSSAPKSNRSYLGYKKALKEVQKSGALPIPNHLKTSQTKLSRDLGHGEDYLYSHDGPSGWVEQTYLPESLIGVSFYEPTSIGFEKNIIDRMAWLRKRPLNPKS